MRATAEECLPGGFVNAVVRVGDTVRRTMPSSSGFVHRLLQHLEACGWDRAPRVLGVGDRGREVLSWVDGQVPWPLDRQIVVRTEASLARVAVLVGELHDLTAGIDLAAGGEVVCHDDLSPKNTVHRKDRSGPSLAADARHLRLVADACGLVDRSTLVDTILWWQDRCWRGIDQQAEAGDPAVVRLRELGGVVEVRGEHDRTAQHRAASDAALTQRRCAVGTNQPGCTCWERRSPSPRPPRRTTARTLRHRDGGRHARTARRAQVQPTRRPARASGPPPGPPGRARSPGRRDAAPQASTSGRCAVARSCRSSNSSYGWARITPRSRTARC